MKVIKTKILKLETTLKPSDKSLTVNVHTDNSIIPVTLKLAKPEQLAENLLSEVKKYLKENTNDNDDFLEGIIQVNIVNDEENFEKVAHFLSKVIEESRVLKTTKIPNNYLQLYSKVTDKKTLILK